MRQPKGDVAKGVEREDLKKTKVEALVVIYVDQARRIHRALREICLVWVFLGFLVMSVSFKLAADENGTELARQAYVPSE